MNTAMRTILIVGVTVLALSSLSQAYTYTTAPSYNSGGTVDQGAGGMIMLNIRFSFTTGVLTMDPQATTVYLAPRPVGSFDPSVAWGVLDGTAYSRRLGFDDVNRPRVLVDQVLAATGGYIWIDKISGSPELKCYYAQNPLASSSTNPITQTYTYYGEMFGTGTSSSKWRWDGMMDHNAYAVDMARITMGSGETFTQTYKIYIGDANGDEIMDGGAPKYQSTTEVWTWTTPVPEPATLTMLALAGAILAARRRRRIG